MKVAINVTREQTADEQLYCDALKQFAAMEMTHAARVVRRIAEPEAIAYHAARAIRALELLRENHRAAIAR